MNYLKNMRDTVGKLLDSAGSVVPDRSTTPVDDRAATPVTVKVVGVGGAGSNAVLRMARHKLRDADLLALNTDSQALNRIKEFQTLAIGPYFTGGMGSGGNADTGRKAAKESQDQIARCLEGADLVFITAGMGGGTGTGAAPVVADIARRQGAIAVGIVTRPFSFEGTVRRQTAEKGVDAIRPKVDTLITIDNDRLLSALDGRVTLDNAFDTANQVLQQGVHGISDIILKPGLVNVDFADFKAVVANGGPSFMAIGEGRGQRAAADAVQAALGSPLFDAPLEGAKGVLFNVRGGKDLTLAQVDEVAGTIREAARTNANVIFGVVQEPRWSHRVSITLVATGMDSGEDGEDGQGRDSHAVEQGPKVEALSARESATRNGHRALSRNGDSAGQTSMSL